MCVPIERYSITQTPSSCLSSDWNYLIENFLHRVKVDFGKAEFSRRFSTAFTAACTNSITIKSQISKRSQN